MNLHEKRAVELAAAKGIVDGAKTAGRDLTAEETATVENHFKSVDDLDVQIKAAEKSDALMARVAGLVPAGKAAEPVEGQAVKSLGEHFAKEVGDEGILRLKTHRGHTVSTTEFKAATDPNTVGSSFGAVLTDVDRTVVQGYRRRPVVADVLGTGTISGNAITYYVEGAVEGGFTTVAEGAQKPQLHTINPTPVTDALKKIAGWWDTSDEMVEDLPFMVSEINNRGLYLLSMAEEAQLLTGAGTGTQVLGLLNRSGIQTEVEAATGDSAQDAIFRAITKVQTATGLAADAIIINPADYQALRLLKDGNGQYFGGGFFAGQYGNGGLDEQPPLWGLRTIVSAAVPAKTVAVGAFQAAATVYRKGGVRVESTNSDQGKFTTNIITTRIEERVALAVRIPSAVVKVTLV